MTFIISNIQILSISYIQMLRLWEVCPGKSSPINSIYNYTMLPFSGIFMLHYSSELNQKACLVPLSLSNSAGWCLPLMSD